MPVSRPLTYIAAYTVTYILSDADLGLACQKKCDQDLIDCVVKCEASDSTCLSNCTRDEKECIYSKFR